LTPLRLFAIFLSVLEDLSLLLDLQTIDNRITEATKLKERLPHDLELCKEEHARIDEELKKQEDMLLEKQKTHRALEGDVETETQKLEKYKRQVFDIKDNKEYQALLHEISTEKQRISQLEDRILELLVEIDNDSGELDKAKDVAAEERKRCEARENELQSKMGEIDDELLVREDERKRLVTRINAELLGRYERIRKGRGGIAVVTLNSGTCSGCFTALPPQFVEELKQASRIMACEHCGRILVWTRDGS
jgi:predicted  nucleic acid-binding Zn-ribbon protein